jgi:hypothetical protein
MEFLKITDNCLIREELGIYKIFDTFQENQISDNYGLIEIILKIVKFQIL